MFACNLSCLLIALTLTNPIICQMLGCWRGSPSGVLGECRASRACEARADCRKCCEHCADPCENRQAPVKPCSCPDDSYCQCLCAGAVIKEAPALDDSQDRLAFDRVTAAGILARPALRSAPDRFRQRFARGKANPGRVVRCLCMSFLC